VQNNFITKISPSVRIMLLVLLISILLMAKSIYLILFITTLTVILFIITGKKVNKYVNAFKKIVSLLLFLLFVYIIIFRQYQIISIIIFTYKLLLMSILIEIFILNTDFRSLHEGLYGILLPLKIVKLNVENVSLYLTLILYFIKLLIDAKDEIKKRQIMRGKKTLNVISFIISSFIYSKSKLNILQDNLKIKFYKLNYKKVNLRSKIIFFLFLLIFIISIFKEVIL